MEEKLKNFEKYYTAAKSYALFLFLNPDDLENEPIRKTILNKDNILGAKVSIMCNVLTNIKENIVGTLPENKTESKVFDKYLEKTVKYVACENNNKYKMGSKEFENASDVVTFIRNKFAHGNYYVNFENKSVVFFDKDGKYEVLVKNLELFIMSAMQNYIKDVKTNDITDSITIYKDTTPLSDTLTKSNIKSIIKHISCIDINVKSKNDDNIDELAIKQFYLIKEYLKNGYEISSPYINNIKSNMEKRGYKVTFNIGKLNNQTEIDKICDIILKTVKTEDYKKYKDDFIRIINNLVLDAKNSSYYKLDLLTGNIKLMCLLDSIDKTNSIDKNILDNYVSNKYKNSILIKHSELASCFLMLINSLYIYLFDDILTNGNNYIENKEDYLDFGKLNIDNINLINFEENYEFYKEAEDLYKSNKLKLKSIEKKLNTLGNQLNNINKEINEKGYNKVLVNYNEVLEKYNVQKQIYNHFEMDYLKKKNDITINSSYFKNLEILKRIRNSIAHGNYKIKVANDLYNTKFNFKDIYNGKTNFEAEITFDDLVYMIFSNDKIVNDFVTKKYNDTKQEELKYVDDSPLSFFDKLKTKLKSFKKSR